MRGTGSKGPALVRAHDALGGILDDEDAMPRGDVADLVHLARDSRIMDRDDDPGPAGDGTLYPVLVDVHGIGFDIHKHEGRAAQREGVGGAGKRERREDNLVPRPHIAQDGGQLQRARAGGGQKRLAGAGHQLNIVDHDTRQSTVF